MSNYYNCILFDRFEALDTFGPAEVISQLPEDYTLAYYSMTGGLIKSSQNFEIYTRSMDEIIPGGVMMIPGGMGTRVLVNDEAFILALGQLCDGADYVHTVCTGTALLAKTGRLDRKNATTNKRAFDWVASNRPQVKWQKKARWVTDGKFYTSSGVTAGIDMALGFVADHYGLDRAIEISATIEHIWHQDKHNDPFAEE